MEEENREDSYLTVKEAAAFLGITACRVRQISALGQLKFLTTAYGKLYLLSQLEEAKKTRPTKRGPKPKEKDEDKL